MHSYVIEWLTVILFKQIFLRLLNLNLLLNIGLGQEVGLQSLFSSLDVSAELEKGFVKKESISAVLHIKITAE